MEAFLLTTDHPLEAERSGPPPGDRVAAGHPGDGTLPCGDAAFVADRSGALVWPAHDLLVVADLHLEKGSSYARCGQLLPPYDTRRTLDLLENALRRWQPKRVLSLGDAFHDREGAARLGVEDRSRLRALIRHSEWIWLLGNHDPLPPEGLGGTAEDVVEIARIVFRHLPDASPAGPEIAGHLHPVARLHRRARSVTRACFVGDGQRILLPAFGAYTGGLDVSDAAIRTLFAARCEAWLLGRRRVHRVPLHRLAA